MSDKYRVDVFSSSGVMFQLLEEFEHLSDANARASVIALQGLRVCITPQCLTYIPAHKIDSVSIYHPTKTFEISAAVLELRRKEDDSGVRESNQTRTPAAGG